MWTSARVGLAAAGLSLFVLQAVRSNGYFSSDEYFQTVELASFKLGITPPADLPWEFHSRMRPFFQPALYYGVAKVLQSAGELEPGRTMLVFRLLSVLTGFVAMLLLWRALAPRLADERARSWFLAACLFTWYLPFLLVRTSSEGLSGSLLAIGLATYLLLERRPVSGALASGLVLGMSFDARYQAAFATVGFFAWLALVRPRRVKVAVAFVFGLAAAIASGVVLDRWGYGEWTLAPWNYLRANLLQGRADAFGRYPLTFYLTHTSVFQPPLSALLLGLLVVFWVKAPRHLITWLTVPFFLAHTMIAHKEVRFLFPLAPVAAVVAPLLLFDSQLTTERFRAFLDTVWGRRLVRVTLGLNVLFLVGLFVIPIRQELSVQNRLWQIAGSNEDIPVVIVGADPFVHVGLQRTFLRPGEWHPIVVQSWDELEARLSDLGAWVYVTAKLSEPPPESLRVKRNVRLLVSPIPEPLVRLLARPLVRTNHRGLWLVEP